MARRRKLLSVCEESAAVSPSDGRPAEGLHAAELNGIPCYDLGEERHFPVRLVLELMLFVC